MKIIFVNEKKSSDENLLDDFKKKEGFEVITVPSLVEAGDKVSQSTSCILVIGPSNNVVESMTFAQTLTHASPNCGSILVSEQLSTKLLKQALRAGFRDVVESKTSDIIEAIFRVKKLVESNPQPKEDENAQAKKDPGKVFTFFSTKGGVGKTVFSTNIAIGLAKQHSQEVILLDLDHHFGDTGVMLGLQPDKTFADLMPAIDRLDVEMLKGLLTRHDSGVKVLLASTKHDAGQQVSDSQLKSLLENARLAAEFVIIDTSVTFGENTLAILDASDCIFLVTTLDVPSVKNTQIALQTLKLLGYPMDRIRLLLNRADSKVSLLPSEVERHLDHKVSVQIPSALAVPRSVNEGTPLLVENQRSPVVDALNEIVGLAKKIGPNMAEAKKKSEVVSK